MADPSLELQTALLAKLTADLGALVGDRVFDEPQVNPQHPYVTLGDCQVLPDKADGIDGVEAYPIINAWSQAEGFAEVKTIAKAIVRSLDDQQLDIEGFELVLFELNEIRYLRDPDGLTRRAIITFHTRIQAL